MSIGFVNAHSYIAETPIQHFNRVNTAQTAAKAAILRRTPQQLTQSPFCNKNSPIIFCNDTVSATEQYRFHTPRSAAGRLTPLSTFIRFYPPRAMHHRDKIRLTVFVPVCSQTGINWSSAVKSELSQLFDFFRLLWLVLPTKTSRICRFNHRLWGRPWKDFKR